MLASLCSCFYQKRRTLTLWLVAVILCLAPASVGYAFTCHRETRRALTFEISKIDPLTEEDAIYQAPLIIENTSENDVVISATFSSIRSFFLVDDVDGKSVEIEAPNALKKTIVVKAKSKFESVVSFCVRNAYIDAHYPIRAIFEYEMNGAQEKVELRPVFATKITAVNPESAKPAALTFGGRSFLKLNGSLGQCFFPYFKTAEKGCVSLPAKWTGSDATGASLNPCWITRGGVNRESWSFHPPYKGGAGDVGVKFAVKLPEATKLELRFFSAMRDVFPPEPPTDGVEFRIYAAHLLGDGNGNVTPESIAKFAEEAPKVENLLYADHYSGVDWKENCVDLTKFAGETVLLTFEANPGAKNDTTCDNCFLGDFVILANPQNGSVMTPNERESLRQKNLEDFLNFVKTNRSESPTSGVAQSEATRCFDLGDGQFAATSLGKNGVCDGWITIGTADRYVQIDGVRAQYQSSNVGYDQPYEPCKVVVQYVESEKLEDYARAYAVALGDPIVGELPNDAKGFQFKLKPNPENTLACFISKTSGGLAFRFVASHNAEINSIQFGAFSEKAKRVYFGQGHCLDHPNKPFTLDGDGFACSTSHVGFDFENGISVLEATTRPVDTFTVNPELKIYTISVAPDTRLTLQSSDKGAFDAAFRYAPGFDKNPAPLVPKKAGRFVFDYWGGAYADVLNRMRTFVKYGLVDSMLIQHVWQHYGYDVRLPDVWPPRTEQGQLEELKETQRFCDQHDIPFGLHDNYIDFYPDADGFTYDEIIINPDGQPQKAWYNPGPDVQSYRFNPTAIFKYAERNLDLIRKDLMQTAYFTDVFSSIHVMSFFDAQGKFHSRAETLDCWGKYFDLVREKFNNNAITVSESGSDVLIGHLDGADGILRRITKEQENYSCVIDCDDNVYAPWGDAIYHDKFILHGVGYSGRYEGGISRALRGIESDDYISAEVLLGRPAMVDLSTSVRGTVRKYWLLQNFARSLAMDRIVDFDFVDGDLHHSRVEWASGVVVYVNRGIADWTLENEKTPGTDRNVTLPAFGFWTTSKDGYGGVVRSENQVVELRVDSDGSYFVNGRQRIPNEVVPIRPSFENVSVIDGSTLKGSLVWDARRGTDKPYTPFLHLERPQTWWGDKPELNVLPLDRPAKSSDQWSGRETDLFGDSITIRIPDEIEPGYYNILCGLYDPKTGARLSLLGSGLSDKRYRLGGITVSGRGANRSITFKEAESTNGLDERLVPNTEATNFGVCQTLGAFRFVQISDSVASITPLPDEPSFKATLSGAFFSDEKYDLVAKDENGCELSRTTLTANDGRLEIEIDASSAFEYDVVKR